MFIIAVLTNASNIAQTAQITGTKHIGFVVGQEHVDLMDEIRKNALRNDKQWDLQFFQNEMDANTALHQNKIEGYTVITTKEAGINATYKANQLANQALTLELEGFLSNLNENRILASYHLTPSQIDQVHETFKMGQVALGESAKSPETIQQSSIVIFILLILIYASVVFYGSTIAIEVASEKSSRIMEVLVSSTPPVQQMFGKIFAVAAVGVTQYGIFFLSGRASYLDGGSSSLLNFSDVPASTFIYAVVFFILGYFLYSTLLAMVGSLASRIEDVYQMISPINFFMIAGFILSIIALADPTSKLVTIMSYVPFFTPMLFFLRISILHIDPLQIGIAITILIATILLFGYIGAKIYKGGVLIYGKTSFKNVKKALQITSKKK